MELKGSGSRGDGRAEVHGSLPHVNSIIKYPIMGLTGHQTAFVNSTSPTQTPAIAPRTTYGSLRGPNVVYTKLPPSSLVPCQLHGHVHREVDGAVPHHPYEVVATRSPELRLLVVHHMCQDSVTQRPAEGPVHLVDVCHSFDKRPITTWLEEGVEATDHEHLEGVKKVLVGKFEEEHMDLGLGEVSRLEGVFVLALVVACVEPTQHVIHNIRVVFLQVDDTIVRLLSRFNGLY